MEVKLKRIVILQHYSPNKGNASLLFSLVENIKKSIPDTNIIVSSYNPEETVKLFGYSVCDWPFCLRNIAEGKRLKKIVNGMIELLFALFKVIIAIFIRLGIVKLKCSKGQFYPLRVLYEANMVVYPGGHLFTNLNHFWGNFSHFFPSLLLVILKKKYIIIGQTVGPFFGFSRKITERLTLFAYNHAEYISTRDFNSIETLSSIGINRNKINKTNEIVYLFPKDMLNNYEIKLNFNNNKKTLGITIHHLYYKRFMSKNEYISHLKKFVDYVKDKYDLNIVFIPMEKERNGKSDHILINEVIISLNNKNNVKLIDLPFDPRYTLNILSKLDFLYATKTHSVIYGLLMKVPTIAIAYAEKTMDFMKDFGLEKYCVYLSGIDTNNCLSMFDDLVNNENEIKKKISDRFEIIKKEAFNNINVIYDLLRNE